MSRVGYVLFALVAILTLHGPGFIIAPPSFKSNMIKGDCPKINLKCQKPSAIQTTVLSRSKSSNKSRGSYAARYRQQSLCQTDRDVNHLATVYSVLGKFVPHLPDLRPELNSGQVLEEIKAGFSVLSQLMEMRERQHKQNEDLLRKELEREKGRRFELEQQIQELSFLDELKTTKALIKAEEDDLQTKMNLIEQRMNETLALKDSFEKDITEREQALKAKELKVKREEVKLAGKAKELGQKERVLTYLSATLDDDRSRLEVQREDFISAKSQWYRSRPSSDLQERYHMLFEDCCSRMLEVTNMYSSLRVSKSQLQSQADALQQDRTYLSNTTQMLEALHEEILEGRQEVAEDVKLIKTEWDLIRNEKERLREAWKVLKMKKEDHASDPSTEESPSKLPDYRTPYDSWNAGTMHLEPVCLSESPVFTRKS